MNDDDAFEGKNLEERTRHANSNLRQMIEVVGGLLAASGELLARLQQILTGVQPAPGNTDASHEPGLPRPTDRGE